MERTGEASAARGGAFDWAGRRHQGIHTGLRGSGLTGRFPLVDVIARMHKHTNRSQVLASCLQQPAFLLRCPACGSRSLALDAGGGLLVRGRAASGAGAGWGGVTCHEQHPEMSDAWRTTSRASIQIHPRT